MTAAKKLLTQSLQMDADERFEPFRFLDPAGELAIILAGFGYGQPRPGTETAPESILAVVAH